MTTLTPPPVRGSFFGDGTGRPRLVWRITIALAGSIVVQVLAGIVLVVVFLVVTRDFRGLEGALKGDLLLIGAATLLASAGTVVILVILRQYVDRRAAQTMGLARPEPGPWSSVWMGFLLGALPIALPALVIRAWGGSLQPAQGPLWQAVFLTVVLAAAALMEELLCRGYLFQNFLDAGRPVLGVGVTAVIFWLFHSLNPHAWSSPIIPLNLLLGGVALALAYRASGNIWFPTALHFAWNLMQGVVLGMPISGMPTAALARLTPAPDAPVWLTGGAFGLESSVLLNLPVALLIPLFLWVIRRRGTPGNDKAAPPAPPAQ